MFIHTSMTFHFDNERDFRLALDMVGHFELFLYKDYLIKSGRKYSGTYCTACNVLTINFTECTITISSK